jgi:mannose-6-phosphate isomerase-like protein (cupin superfamily)
METKIHRINTDHKFRRIVTGHNEKGKSVVLFEKQPIEYGVLLDMWRTDRSPASNSISDDTADSGPRLEPFPNGTVLRFFQCDPEDPSLSKEEIEKLRAARFEYWQAEHCRPDTTRGPQMHRTKTLDYIIVLEGEVTLLLDDEDVDLKPFDVVIQQGTNHGWINKSSKPALLASIMIDAEPLPNK